MRAAAVPLLDIEPALAAGLDQPQAAEARRRLIVPAFDIPAGALALDVIGQSSDVVGEPWGIYLCSGTLLHRVWMQDRACARLLGAGDLLLLEEPTEGSIATRQHWQVREEARIVMLDDRLLAAGQRWPALMRGVQRCAAMVTARGHAERAVSQLPRVEDRLLAFFWMLADRRGRMGPDGVTIELPLTHDELGELVGARRSTVTLGLHRLINENLITSSHAGWQLAPDSLSRFQGNTTTLSAA